MRISDKYLLNVYWWCCVNPVNSKGYLLAFLKTTYTAVNLETAFDEVKSCLL